MCVFLPESGLLVAVVSLFLCKSAGPIEKATAFCQVVSESKPTTKSRITMATYEMEVPDEKIQEMLQGDRGIAVLLEPILNQILQSEMTEHLGAESGERTDSRSGYRNGTYQRKLTTRVGTLELEVPRDREGTFQTELFQRYQRSEKALVLALMQMVVQGVSTRRVKNITAELCGREFSRSTVSRLTGDLEKQVDAWAERTPDVGYCSSKDTFYHGVKLHVIAQKRKDQLPLLGRAGLTSGGENDLQVLPRALPTIEGGILCGDKVYSDGPLKERLGEDQSLNLLTPIKKEKGQKTLPAADKLYSEAVSRIRKPIESLFSWIDEKTGIQRASKVLSYQGLVTDVFGRLAAAMLILALNP